MQRSWFILVAVLAIIGIALGGMGLAKINTLGKHLSTLEEAYPTIKANLSIDYGGVMRTESYNLTLPGGATAWDALNRVAKVELVRSEEEKALFLEINGVGKGKDHEDYNWALYLDGVPIPLSLGALHPLENGARVLFKYEKIPQKPAEKEKQGKE